MPKNDNRWEEYLAIPLRSKVGDRIGKRVGYALRNSTLTMIYGYGAYHFLGEILSDVKSNDALNGLERIAGSGLIVGLGLLCAGATIWAASYAVAEFRNLKENK